MRTLASYADKDKENVYETPGFNKTKNPTLVDLFINWFGIYWCCFFMIQQKTPHPLMSLHTLSQKIEMETKTSN